MTPYLLIVVIAACPRLLYGAGLGSIFFNDEPPRLPVCASMNKPCDVLVRSSSRGGKNTTEYQSSNSICSCPGTSPCPSGWDSDPQRTLTRRLRSRGKHMTLQMKFCTPMEPQKKCRGQEVALKMRGGGVLPLEVMAVNCRCPRGRQMHLHRSWNEGWRTYQEFKCRQPSCEINRTAPPACMDITRTRSRLGPRHDTVYPCMCPDGWMCTVDSSRIPSDGKAEGHCEQIMK